MDTAVPCYQFTSDESWNAWDWQETFPGRDEIQSYMRHLDDVWDLSKDVSYNSRVTAMNWNSASMRWDFDVEGEHADTFHSQFVVLSTGFASKPYIPPYKDIDVFRGELHHTGLWPQNGVDLKGKRVAVIGTGASGVQLIQNAGLDAAHLTVFQRTPNTAIPMENPKVSAALNKHIKDTYADTREKIYKTFAGFDYEFAEGSAVKTPKEQRMEMYERLFHTGGSPIFLISSQLFLLRSGPGGETTVSVSLCQIVFEMPLNATRLSHTTWSPMLHMTFLATSINESAYGVTCNHYSAWSLHSI